MGRRREQFRRIMSGEYMAYKVAENKQARFIIEKTIRVASGGMTDLELWKVAQKMDEKKRKGSTVSGACMKHKHKYCPWVACVDACHKNDIWVEPLFDEKGMRLNDPFAWVAKELNTVGGILNA